MSSERKRVADRLIVKGAREHNLRGVDLDLPLDEPTRAAQRYIALGPNDVQTAFRKWLRPDDLVRVSEGPTPQ